MPQEKKIVYSYDQLSYFYTGPYSCQWLEAEQRFGIPADCTEIEPPAFDSQINYLKFNEVEQKWETIVKTITAYMYDTEYKYIGEVPVGYNAMRGRYIMPINSTTSKPPEYDPTIQSIIFDHETNEWIIVNEEGNNND